MIYFKRKSFPFFALFVAMIYSISGQTSTIAVGYGETIDEFTMSIVGGDFNLDDSHSVLRGTNWSIITNISEDAGFINDVLSFNGSAQHIISPHGEGLGTIFNFNFVVDADNFLPGPHTLVSPIASLLHAGHQDIFSASLSFTTETTLNFDDITGYTITLKGTHVPVPAAV